jgi:imidazolonepropionase-like amidohydrolase
MGFAGSGALSPSTLGGAWALGLADETGQLAIGRRAEFIAVDGTPIDPGFTHVKRRGADTLLSPLICPADSRGAP